MINAIVNGLFTLVQGLIAIVLAPIDLLLSGIPGLVEAANGVQTFRSNLANIIAYPMDLLTPVMLSAVFGFITARLFFANASRAVSLIKLAYNWLQKIKFW